MPIDSEPRQFIDRAGLETFWADVQTFLTRNYKTLPAGMQFSQIYQLNGQLHILVEPFGGSTTQRKEASRTSLDVYSKDEVDAAIRDNGGYIGQKTLYELNNMPHEPHNGDSVNVKFGPNDSEYIDPATGFGRIYNMWDGVQDHSYIEVLDGDNIIYDRRALTHVWDRQTGNYKIRQAPVSVSMDTYETVLDISQDDNGNITVHKKEIPTAAVGQLGLTTLKGSIGTDETDNGTAATPKAVRNAIDAAIDDLDVAEIEFGPVDTVGTIEEVDGKIVVIPREIRTATTEVSGITTLNSATVSGGTLSSDETMAVTALGVKNAIESLDVAEVAFGPVQTVGTIEEIDGKIVVTPQNIRTATTEVSGITTLTSATAESGEIVETENKAVTPLGVKNAIGTLYVGETTLQASETISSISETDGKISVSTQAILAGEANIDTGAVTETKIGTGAVTETKIGAGAVTETKIGTGAVTNTKLGDNSVSTGKIIAGAVTTEKIAEKAVTTSKIDDGAVTTGQIGAKAVTTVKIDDGAVTADQLDDGAVTTEKIADGAVTTKKLDAEGGIDGAVLKNRTVTGIKIAYSTITGSSMDPDTGIVTAGNIVQGTISGREISTGNNGVDTANLVDHAVTADKLATDSVQTGHILDGSVTTEKLHDLAVTTGKLGAGAVTDAKIADEAVTADKIATHAVTSDKIDLQAVTTEKIADLNVTEGKLAGDAVTTSKIADGNVTEAKLATDSVTTSKIADENVTTEKLADVSVTTGKIADGNVTTGKIADLGITTEKLADGAVTPAKVSSGEYKIDIRGDAETASAAKEGSALATTLAGLDTGKADKVSNATPGNFAGLDANGNLTDSGHKASDFKTVQATVSDPTADGAAVTFIDTISQNANGVISATKKTVQTATTSIYGITRLNSSTVVPVNDSQSQSEDETMAVTALGVKNAIDYLDSRDSREEKKVVRAVNVSNGKIAVTKDTLGISDIDQLGTRLGNIESGKADKVASAIAGNFASLDSNGNLVDSGSKAADFVQMTDLQALDLAQIGGDGEYISVIKQENGQAYATATTMDTSPTANSTNAVTSGGVRSAIDGAINALNVSDSAVENQFVTAVQETAGQVSISRRQPVIDDVSGLRTELNSKQNTLTFDGTYNADTNKVATVSSITSRLGELDLASQGGADGNYISQVKQTDGKVDVTVSSTLGTLDTTSNAPVNSSAVDSAITGAIAALDSEVESTDGTNIQVKVTQVAGEITAVSIATDNTESTANKVSSWSSTVNDTNYPTEKLVKDSLDLKANKSEMTVTQGTGADADKTTIQLKTGTSATVLTAHQDITGKADKVSGATAGNLASLDANGNIVDSGVSYIDMQGEFKPKQTAQPDPTASGNALSFIDTITQDVNGVITATKKTVSVDSTYSSSGTNPVNGTAVAAALGTLDVNDISGFGAGKTLATLTETDGKIAATFQDIEITKSQVSDFPTEMTPSSHTHGNITNDGKIGTTADLGIVTGTGGTVTTKDFTQASPTTGSGTTTEFISTVAQGSNGAISATKKAITPASTSTAGIVQLSSSINSSSETMAATPKAVSDLGASLGADKADKVSGATTGNFAGLDSNGNLTDSGKKSSDFANAAQGSKADTAIQGVKVNGTELNKDSLNKVDITAVTGVKGSSESTYRTGQVSITAGNVGAYTTAEVDAELALKEDAANKKQTVNTSSTTEFPTSAAVAAFVNSSIATATANFLGNYTLTDLGLTYPATNAQIEGALGSYAWPAGVTPTNNDYVLISINSSTDPDTGEPIIDEYRRFKYNDGESSWAYEYTLNNSSFTSAQWSAINSGITAGDKSAYDAHLADTSNPHRVTAAQVGLGNVNNTADLDKPISTATQAALDDKVDKVSTAIENHIAVFDNAGNIRDSGKTYSDMQGEFKQKQTAKPSPTASGNALSFIDTVSQDADGVITASKRSVTVDSTYSSSGTNPVNGKAIKAAIDGLDAAIASNDGTNVQVKVTEADGKISAVNITTDNTENRSNKVSSWQPTPDNTHYPTEKLVKYSLDGKVDKVEGKGLSTEDYTTAEKTKLAGIAAGAEVNQNAFSSVIVGSTAIAAESKTDTLEIAGGTGIDAVGDTANDKVTLSLNPATQTSLGKADSAVQSVKINGGSELKDDNGNVSIPLAVATGSTGAKAGALSSDDKKKLNDLGTAAFKNVSTSGNAGNDEVVLGSDTRLSAGASAVQDVTVDGASVVNSSTKVAAVPNASTSSKGAVQLAGSIGATVASENNKAATEKAVRDAINALDSNKTSTDGTNVQVKVTEADGKISAVNIAADNTENKNNKVTAWSSTVSDTNYPSEKLVKGSLDNKVDKVTGKGLSTNDYTTAEKNKLAGIESGAEVNQNAFSSVTVGTDTIQADTKTDTLTLVAGSNVQLAADTATDTVTISATDTTYGADRGISLVSGKFGHSNAAVTGASVGPSDAVTGVSVSVPRFTFDGYGHVTAASDKTFTVRSGSTSQTGVVRLQGSIGATESEDGKAATPKAVRDAINALDVASVGGSGNVIVSISEEDGKISATAGKLSASGGALSYSGEIDEDFCLTLSNVVFAD